MNDEDFHSVCAMLAMLGITTRSQMDADDVAKRAFGVADAMLDELRRRQEPEEGIVAIKATRKRKAETD